VDFLGDVFFDGANIAFAAPPSSRRQQWGGGNVYQPGEHLRENTYENGAISITPTVWIDKIPADSCRQGMECLRLKIMGMFEDARLYEQHQQDSGKLVKLFDDHKGFDIESQIIDGWVEGLDDLDAFIIDQGVAHFTVTMTRKPFRYAAWVNGWGEEGERLENLVQEPSFLQDANADGLADNWVEINAVDVTPTLTVNPRLTGEQSQRVQTVLDAGQDTGIRTWRAAEGITGWNIPTTNGIEYYLSANIYHRGGDRVTLKVYDEPGAAYIAGARLQWTYAADGDGWVERSLIFTALGASTSIDVVIEAADSTGATDWNMDKFYMVDRRDLIASTTERVGWASGCRIATHWDEDGVHPGDGTSQSHKNTLDIEDVYGDIPIKPDIRIEHDQTVGYLATWPVLGAKWNNPYAFDHWEEFGGVGDASCSGGSRLDTPSVAVTWTTVGAYVQEGDDNYGSFLVYSRVRSAVAGARTYYLRLRYGLYDTVGGAWDSAIMTTDPVFITLAAGDNWWDGYAGTVRFPKAAFAKWTTIPDDFRIELQVYDAGVVTYGVDYLCLVPVGGGLMRLNLAVTGVDSVAQIALMLRDDTATGVEFRGPTERTIACSWKGETPTLYHRGPTRMIFMGDEAEPLWAATVADKWALFRTVWRPTFL